MFGAPDLVLPRRPARRYGSFESAYAMNASSVAASVNETSPVP
jgi:hypothetical protein